MCCFKVPIWNLEQSVVSRQKEVTMSTEIFTHDVFLSHSAKDNAVVRPLAERLRQDGLNRLHSELQHSAFSPSPSFSAPIKGFLAQFLYINWLPGDREQTQE